MPIVLRRAVVSILSTLAASGATRARRGRPREGAEREGGAGRSRTFLGAARVRARDARGSGSAGRAAWLVLASSIPAVVPLFVVCAFVSAPVSAHTTLLEASPAAGDELSSPPEEVRLRFDEPVDGAFDPLKVLDTEGSRVDREDARLAPEDARVLVAGLEELPEGSYRVEWRVASVDGHVASGKYGFAVAGAEGARDGAENGDGKPAPRGTDPGDDAGPFGTLPRTLVFGVLSVGALSLLSLLALLGGRLARRPEA